MKIGEASFVEKVLTVKRLKMEHQVQKAWLPEVLAAWEELEMRLLELDLVVVDGLALDKTLLGALVALAVQLYLLF